MSGVEEGGGEPSSGSTPDKKVIDGVIRAMPYLLDRRPKASDDRYPQILSVTVPNASAVFSKAEFFDPDLRGVSFLAASFTGLPSIISGNPAAAANPIQHLRECRDTRAETHNPCEADILPSRQRTKSAEDRGGHQR